MFEAYKEFWVRYVDFGGTSSRPKFWYVVLINALIGAAISILNAVNVEAVKVITYIIDALYGLACFLPSLAIDIRRLRDAGKDWTNIFWCLLPIVGWIILLVYFCQPSVQKETEKKEEA